MKMIFRWYGTDQEKITLDDIRQIPGVTGVAGCLMDIPTGEVWSEERIKALVDQVEAKGLMLKVIESVNVHDDIKIGLPDRDKYIRNYKQTIKNLAKYGHGTNGYMLPGWEPERLSHLRYLFELYRDVDEQKLRENLVYFLKAIIPTCEECDVKMAIHPDDPPYSLFGLPRIIKNRDDLDWLCTAVDSPYNGITLCCGSISEDPANNVYAILDEFSHRKRIHFVHMRNIKFMHPDDPTNKDFYECAHESRYGSLDMYRMCKILFDNGFDGFMRPDHGRMIWGETGRPGYELYDRALGITYINGIWESLEKQAQE